MADKRLIRSLFKLTGLLIGASALIFLLVAAVRIRRDKVCTDVSIKFKGGSVGRYVESADIAAQMWPGGIPSLKNRPLGSLDLSLMEQRIEQDPWVRNAELFIDANDKLQVIVEEQEPVARVFTREGISFYIDSALRRIPLNRRFTPNLPVFTGLPVSASEHRGSDSAWMSQVLAIVSAMRTDSLWLAQMEECAYEPPLGFVMYPMAGEHRIIFGDATSAHDKFRNLFVFYAKVLAREGWNSYKTIDLRFDRQVVAIPAIPNIITRKTPDSIHADAGGTSTTAPVLSATRLSTSSQVKLSVNPSTKTNSRTPRLVMPTRQRSP
jgi:cell division protein FtsQ